MNLRLVASQPMTESAQDMFVYRTRDRGFVESVLRHPGVKPHVWDRSDEPQAPIVDSVYYLVPQIERQLGIVVFVPANDVAWTAHSALYPWTAGLGTTAMKLGIEWMFRHTACRKIVADPPAFNARMVRVFEKCGLKREGMSPKSFSWHGELHDRVLMGIERGIKCPG